MLWSPRSSDFLAGRILAMLVATRSLLLLLVAYSRAPYLRAGLPHIGSFVRFYPR